MRNNEGIRIVNPRAPAAFIEATPANGRLSSADRDLLDSQMGVQCVADNVLYGICSSDATASATTGRYRLVRINIPANATTSGIITVDQISFTGTEPPNIAGLSGGDRGRIYNRWRYVPEVGCCMLINGMDQNVWAYRPAEAVATEFVWPVAASAAHVIPGEHPNSLIHWVKPSGTQGPWKETQLHWSGSGSASTEALCNWIGASGTAQGNIPVVSITGITDAQEDTTVTAESFVYMGKGLVLRAPSGSEIIDFHASASVDDVPHLYHSNGSVYPAYLTAWVRNDSTVRTDTGEIQVEPGDSAIGLVRFDAPEGTADMRIRLKDKFGGGTGQLDIYWAAQFPTRHTMRPVLPTPAAGLGSATASALVVLTDFSSTGWVSQFQPSGSSVQPFTDFSSVGSAGNDELIANTTAAVNAEGNGLSANNGTWTSH